MRVQGDIEGDCVRYMDGLGWDEERQSKWPHLLSILSFKIVHIYFVHKLKMSIIMTHCSY